MPFHRQRVSCPGVAWPVMATAAGPVDHRREDATPLPRLVPRPGKAGALPRRGVVGGEEGAVTGDDQRGDVQDPGPTGMEGRRVPRPRVLVGGGGPSAP